MTHYPHLFDPIPIGSLVVPNRIMMSAMSINFGVDEDGFVTDQLTAYLAARAAGGAGMVLVGGGAVDPGGLELPQLPILWTDDAIGPLRQMTDRIRAHGARFGMQLLHGGRQSYLEKKVAPSAIRAPAVVKSAPRALATDEIPGLIDAFAQAARRCRDAGFDFIEIHGAHGYLINQFLSPNANHRTDRYGGCFENRVRFLMELLAAVHLAAGADFPVGVRINGNDFIDNGWTLADATALAPMLEKAGAAYLHVSAGVYGSTELTIPPMYVPQGCFVQLAETVKAATTLPVVAVGRIKSPEMAESIIAEKRADMVALGRSFLADPEWPKKVRNGTADRIRPCIGCCLGCIHQVLALEPGSCVVNPSVGREYLLGTPLSFTKKKILVVGAGPAGLAAARTAADAGHSVTVWETGPMIGGLGRLAAMPPGRGEIGEIIDFFHAEAIRCGARIVCDMTVDAAAIDSLAPDVVLYAAGSLPDTPLIRGLFQSGIPVCSSIEVFTGEADVGPHAVVLGGGQVALTTADFLADTGHRVTVLNRGHHFADTLSSNDRYYLRERLSRQGVQLFKKTVMRRITDTTIDVDHSAGTGVHVHNVDTIVLAERRIPIRDSLPLFQKMNVPVHVIGDANAPRGLMHAIAEAEEVAARLDD